MILTIIKIIMVSIGLISMTGIFFGQNDDGNMLIPIISMIIALSTSLLAHLIPNERIKVIVEKPNPTKQEKPILVQKEENQVKDNARHEILEQLKRDKQEKMAKMRELKTQLNNTNNSEQRQKPRDQERAIDKHILTCHICRKRFQTLRYLKRHYNRKHNII